MPIWAVVLIIAAIAGFVGYMYYLNTVAANQRGILSDIIGILPLVLG
jgi:hypothetical protein